MNGLAVYWEAMQLPHMSTLVVKFANEKESMSGELRLNSDIQFLDKKRTEQLKTVLRNLAPYMTEKYII